MKTVSPSQMKHIDRIAIKQFLIDGALLMENAGRAIAEALCALDDMFVCKHAVMILCGQGNNGGDGFVAARHLFSKGFQIKIVFIGDFKKLSTESLLNYNICNALGIEISSDYSDLPHYPFIIDALFGTGLDREITGIYGDIIEKLNSADSFVVSADIPSGVHGEYGHIMGCAVNADVTVTFGLPKVGMLLYPGYEKCGKIVCADISLPPQILNDKNLNMYAVHRDLAAAMFPKRRASAHKGQCGRVTVFAGSPGMSGAAVLCSKAALRSGAGLVYSVVSESIKSDLAVVTEAVKILLPDTLNPDITHILKTADCVAAGPGWSESEASVLLLEQILKFPYSQKLILDADALNIVSGKKEMLKNTVHSVVITPHIGEMARLCGVESEEIIRYPVKYAADFAAEYNVTVVLKSARTVIATPEGIIYLNMSGNPFMATGGMGDVLTGFIASFAAQGCNVSDAAVLGVFLHGFIGDICAEKRNLSLLPSDIIESAGDGIAAMLGAEL